VNVPSTGKWFLPPYYKLGKLLCKLRDWKWKNRTDISNDHREYLEDRSRDRYEAAVLGGLVFSSWNRRTITW
jgi:hypothetical protein